MKPAHRTEYLRTVTAYASLGWKLIPIHERVGGGACTCGRPKCQGGKPHARLVPAEAHASSVVEEIDNWLDQWEETSWGLMPGASGLVILEVSDREDGRDTLRLLKGDRPAIRTPLFQPVRSRYRYVFAAFDGDSIPEVVKLGDGLRLLGGNTLIPLPRYTDAPVRQERRWLHSPKDSEVEALPVWLRAPAGLPTGVEDDSVRNGARPEGRAGDQSPGGDGTGDVISDIGDLELAGSARGLSGSSSPEGSAPMFTADRMFGAPPREATASATVGARETAERRDGLKESGAASTAATESAPSASSVDESQAREPKAAGPEADRDTDNELFDFGPASRDELPFQTLSSAGVHKHAALRWYAQPWLAQNAMTVLTGPPKLSGMTLFWLHAVAGIVQNTSFLGRPCRKTKVAYVSSKSPQVLCTKMQNVDVRDASAFENIHVLYAEQLGEMDRCRLVPAAGQYARQHGIDVVIFDGIEMLISEGQPSDALADRGFVEPFSRALGGVAVGISCTVPIGTGSLQQALEEIGWLGHMAETVGFLSRPDPRKTKLFRLETVSEWPDVPSVVNYELQDQVICEQSAMFPLHTNRTPERPPSRDKETTRSA